LVKKVTSGYYNTPLRFGQENNTKDSNSKYGLGVKARQVGGLFALLRE
jgi:hypothetical protein